MNRGVAVPPQVYHAVLCFVVVAHLYAMYLHLLILQSDLLSLAAHSSCHAAPLKLQQKVTSDMIFPQTVDGWIYTLQLSANRYAT